VILKLRKIKEENGLRFRVLLLDEKEEAES